MRVWLFVISILAIYRITSLLTFESGPYGVFDKLRIRSRRYTDVLDCVLCTSLWLSLPFSFLFPYWFISWMGLSTGAIALEKIFDWMEEH